MIMTKANRVLELIRNKTKRVNLAMNPKLWDLFERMAKDEGMSPTHKIEDLIISNLEERGYLDD